MTVSQSVSLKTQEVPYGIRASSQPQNVFVTTRQESLEVPGRNRTDAVTAGVGLHPYACRALTSVNVRDGEGDSGDSESQVGGVPV